VIDLSRWIYDEFAFSFDATTVSRAARFTRRLRSKSSLLRPPS